MSKIFKVASDHQPKHLQKSMRLEQPIKYQKRYQPNSPPKTKQNQLHRTQRQYQNSCLSKSNSKTNLKEGSAEAENASLGLSPSAYHELKVMRSIY